jgi:hypothetical protein
MHAECKALLASARVHGGSDRSTRARKQAGPFVDYLGTARNLARLEIVNLINMVVFLHAVPTRLQVSNCHGGYITYQGMNSLH